MQRFSIPIGTGNNGDLASGLPLFPVLGTARAGISNTDRSNTLVDFELTILFSRTKFHSYYGFLLGVLGPAVAFEIPGTQVALSNPVPGGGGLVTAVLGSNQQMIAGLSVGVVVGAGFTVTQQFYLPERWYSPWKFSWRTAFELSYFFAVDFIKLLFKLIQLLINRGVSKGYLNKATGTKLTKYLKYAGGIAEAFNFIDFTHQGFGPANSLTVTPTFTIPIDLVSAISGLGNFVRRLSAIVGELQFGPQFEVRMPVTLALDSFVTKGGQGVGSTAEYGPISYQGSTATAPGPLAFQTDASTFTTNVTYSTGFTVALSFFFKVKVCKLFDVGKTIGSLDLLRLLNLPVPPHEVAGSVSSNVQSGCILIPQMTIRFVSGDSDPNFPPQLNTVVTEVPFLTTVELDEAWAGPNNTTVAIAIEPAAAGFPSSATINRGEKQVSVKYTFGNKCITSGNSKGPPTSMPPNAISPYQSYLVRATIDSDNAQPCDDWEITAPLKVQNRTLVMTLGHGAGGEGPAYQPEAGGQINADKTKEPLDIPDVLQVKYFFPYPPGVPPGLASVKLSLLTAERTPHLGSQVRITFDSGVVANLAQPVTVAVPLAVSSSSSRTFTVEWLSKGPDVNYSSLFILVMNAGCQFGEAEFWLSVWNWS